MNAADSTPPWALSCRGVAKSFGDNQALSGADLDVRAGSIHALVGENGAGKSTLMNMVSGQLTPDAGSVEVLGGKVAFRSPLDAVAAGIGMVHQHFMLAEALSVAENIALGRRRSPLGWRYPRTDIETEIRQLAATTGLHVDPTARVSDLPVGLRQRVEILKALSRGARILLLDEPTAVLAPPEIKSLFDTLRRLRDEGRTIMLITHKLDEVFALCDSVTVLRRGQSVFAGALEGLTPETLAEKMVGEAKDVQPAGAFKAGATVLSVRDLSVLAEQGSGLKSVSFEVQAGEVLGVAGVEGNGQDELLGALAGTSAAEAGAAVTLGTTNFHKGRAGFGSAVRARSTAGLAVIPGDRHRDGLVLDLTLAENLHLRDVYDTPNPVGRGMLIDGDRMRARGHERLEAYGVHPAAPDLPARALSGGNQQKVVVARELSRRPKAVVASNPTRGLDVRAAAAVHEKLLHAARKDNAAVLLISSDLDEVLRLADRVAVLYGGRWFEIGARGVTKDAVGRAMVGAGVEQGGGT